MTRTTMSFLVAIVTVAAVGSQSRADALRKTKPIRCTGTKNRVIKNAVISTKGVAVQVAGTCNIRIVDSRISGGEAALRIAGSGNIHVTRSQVESSGSAISIQGSGNVKLSRSKVTGGAGGAAIDLEGTGHVIADDTTFRGTKRTTGHGKYVDRGGNRWLTAAAPEADEPPADSDPAEPQADAGELAAQGPIVCARNDDLTIDNALIEGTDVAVRTEGNCTLVIRNSTIRADQIAVMTQGSSRVKLVNTKIFAKAGALFAQGSSDVVVDRSELRARVALAVEGSATLRLGKSSLRGSRRVGSSATFIDQGGNRVGK